jgi:hypothetical protein
MLRKKENREFLLGLRAFFALGWKVRSLLGSWEIWRKMKEEKLGGILMVIGFLKEVKGF